MSDITGTTSTPNYVGNVNVLGVEDVQFESCNLTASVNDPWYYALFTETNNVYNGTGFGFGVTTMVSSWT